jgi:hypothetical protein
MKNNKEIIIIVAVLVLTVAAIALIRLNRTPTAVSGASVASVTEGTFVSGAQVFSFGRVSMRDGVVRHDFKLKNDSGDRLRITSVSTSCMCTKAIVVAPDGEKQGPFGMPGHGGSSSADIAVPAGGEVTVQVVFDPAAHGPAGIGRVSREVGLTTDKGQTVVSFVADVTP